MYITKADYRTRISIDLLNMLLAEDEAAILADCSQMAEDTIRIHVGVLYNINDELLQTGSLRNGYIKSLAISIALYEVYQRADDEQVPEKVIKNYDDAIDDLAKISMGKKSLNLPPPTTPTEGSEGTSNDEIVATTGIGLRRMGSQYKRSHQV